MLATARCARCVDNTATSSPQAQRGS
jgi:hypothetical protein